MTMPISHANALLQNRAIMPKKGEVCSPACYFYTWCVNYQDSEECKGFLLVSNGQIARHIKSTFEDSDHLYVERYIKDIQDYPQSAHKLVPIVLRYLKPEQLKTGFRAMLEEAFRGEPVTRAPPVIAKLPTLISTEGYPLSQHTEKPPLICDFSVCPNKMCPSRYTNAGNACVLYTKTNEELMKK